MAFVLTPGRLTLAGLRRLRDAAAEPLALEPTSRDDVARGAATVARVLATGAAVYGVNTGFGKLAQTRIPDDKLRGLQESLVLSHSVGVGEPLAPTDPRLGTRGCTPRLSAAIRASSVSTLMPE